jgi:hypothetical protein
MDAQDLEDLSKKGVEQVIDKLEEHNGYSMNYLTFMQSRDVFEAGFKKALELVANRKSLDTHYSTDYTIDDIMSTLEL